jgi:copper resistance protein C
VRRRIAAALLLAALIAAMGAAARTAMAHALVVESEPAPGARISPAPGAVRIRFNSKIERRLSRLSLIGPDKRPVPLTIVSDEPGKEARPDRLTALLPPLGPGAHAIRWRVLAADGHITEGTIRFTVAPSP